MLLSLFILFALCFAYFEAEVFSNSEKYSTYIIDLKKRVLSTDLTPLDTPFLLFNAAYFIWILIGIHTIYWYIFITLLILQFVKNSTINQGTRSNLIVDLCILLNMTLLIYLVAKHFIIG